MSVAATPLDRARAEREIVDALAANGLMSPVALIDQLIARGIREDVARTAIWTLIGRKHIELTSDRKLLLDRVGSW